MKVVITVPSKIYRAGEQVARERGLSRSAFYSKALSRYIAEHRAAAITARLNKIYGREDSRLDPAWTKAQQEPISDEAW